MEKTNVRKSGLRKSFTSDIQTVHGYGDGQEVIGFRVLSLLDSLRHRDSQVVQ